MRVAANCSTVADAIAALDTTAFDLVVLDYDLGFQRGTDFLDRVRADGFTGKVLVLAAWLEHRDIRELLSHGISGIVLKERPLDLVVHVIRTVCQGGQWMDERCMEVLVATNEMAVSDSVLSKREREVLRRIVAGRANKEIGAELNSSESSIKAAVQRLFDKCGVRSRSQLVRVAIERFPELL